MSATAAELPATGAAPAAAPEQPAAAPPSKEETEAALIEAMKDLFAAGKEMAKDINDR